MIGTLIDQIQFASCRSASCVKLGRIRVLCAQRLTQAALMYRQYSIVDQILSQEDDRRGDD